MVMRSPNRILALWALLLSLVLAVPAAKASVVVTVAATGTILSEAGDLSIVTGSPAPATLIGTAFTITQTYSEPVFLDDAGGLGLFAGLSVVVAVDGFLPATFTPVVDPTTGGLMSTLYDAGSLPPNDVFWISAQGSGPDATGGFLSALVSGAALDPDDKSANILVNRSFFDLVAYQGADPVLGFSLADAKGNTLVALFADNVKSLTVRVTEVTEVPEPGSLALLALGAAGLMLLRRRASGARLG